MALSRYCLNPKKRGGAADSGAAATGRQTFFRAFAAGLRYGRPPYWRTTVITITPLPLDVSLIESERNILARIARGGPLRDVLRDLIVLVEQPSGGEMLASILFLSPDGERLLEGAAPSLPEEYNAAINGIRIGPNVGSCGTAVFRGEPVYVSDIATDPLWTDFRELALKHGLRACWSVPIRSSEGSVLGTFANYYREPREPTVRDMNVIAMVAQTAAIAIERHRVDQERERTDEQRLLLLRELNHRVKNVFMLANSLIILSAKSATDPQSFAHAVQGRLQALSRAHELVQPGLYGLEAVAPKAVSLRDVIEDILAPYAPAGGGSRVSLHGDHCTLSPDATPGIALVLHELATNAAKYGALSVEAGRVDVRWTLGDDRLHLSWIERGGPVPIQPKRTSFGTVLTKRTIEGQFRGAVAYDWAETGLGVTISLPLAAVTAQPAPTTNSN